MFPFLEAKAYFMQFSIIGWSMSFKIYSWEASSSTSSCTLTLPGKRIASISR